jgi:hypothetical protein
MMKILITILSNSKRNTRETMKMKTKRKKKKRSLRRMKQKGKLE